MWTNMGRLFGKESSLLQLAAAMPIQEISSTMKSLNITHRRKLAALSLFAGGGGLSLGLESAGFETVFATDVAHSSQETFALNFPGVPFWEGDIRRLTQDHLRKYVAGRKIDLVVGGPPCQGFSTLGDQNPSDARNGLFWCFKRVVEWLKPTCFLMENVNYLRTQYGGRYEQEIVHAFESFGYAVSVTTLNSADFGVPQIRKRVFFFGTLRSSAFAWPEATHGAGKKAYEGVWAAIRDLELGSSNIPNHLVLRHGEKVVSRYRLIPEGGRMPPPSALPAEIRRKNFGNTYKRLHRDKPSLTLVPGNNAFPVHPVQHRSLSPREAARLQTFPDTHLFAGSRAEQCKLVGNAVPVLLAQRIGEAIFQHLDESRGKTELRPQPHRAVHTKSLQLVACERRPTSVLAKRSRSGLKTVSFFTGVGGLMSGFLNAGYDVLLSYDQKNSVAKNLALNFPSIKHLRADIGVLTVDQIQQELHGSEVDVVIGGPPCQGFSIFGRRRFVNTKDHQPDKDERNELALRYLELAVGLRPKAIFFENVKGFVSTQRGTSSYLEVATAMLHKAGFKVESKVVNCAAYGIPQLRERFILIAWKRGYQFQWPDEKHFSEPKPWQKPYVTVGDVISDLMDPSTCNLDFSHAPMNHKELVVARYELIAEGGRLPEDGLPEHLAKGYRSDRVKNYSHVYKRLSMNAPATTMVPGHNAFPVHPRLHRTLTVREAARIQTFPDSMQFVGTRQQQCTLVGNAVPPLLAEIFATHLKKTIQGNFASAGFKRDIYDLALSR